MNRHLYHEILGTLVCAGREDLVKVVVSNRVIAMDCALLTHGKPDKDAMMDLRHTLIHNKKYDFEAHYVSEPTRKVKGKNTYEIYIDLGPVSEQQFKDIKLFLKKWALRHNLRIAYFD